MQTHSMASRLRGAFETAQTRICKILMSQAWQGNEEAEPASAQEKSEPKLVLGMPTSLQGE